MAEREKDRLLVTLQAIMADRRQKLGDPPTPEDLLDYQYGRLSEEGRQELEEKIVAFPEAARALADLSAFPEVTVLPGDRRFSDDELSAGWETFRRRLQAAPGGPAAAEALPKTVFPGSRSDQTVPRRLPALGWMVAAALAGLTVGFGAGWKLTRPPGTAELPSAINVTIVQLFPLGLAGERAAGKLEEVDLPTSSEELVLVLSLFESGTFTDYEAVVRGAEGQVVWRRRGLAPTPFGTFQLSFRRSLLPPGLYQVQLLGWEGEQPVSLAVYELQLTAGPGL